MGNPISPIPTLISDKLEHELIAYYLKNRERLRAGLDPLSSTEEDCNCGRAIDLIGASNVEVYYDGNGRFMKITKQTDVVFDGGPFRVDLTVQIPETLS